MKIISNKEYEIIKLKQDNNKLYIQELEKRIEEISGANKCYKLENRRLRKKINRVIEELKLWQPEIEALKMEKNYLLDILEGRDNEERTN